MPLIFLRIKNDRYILKTVNCNNCGFFSGILTALATLKLFPEKARYQVFFNSSNTAL